MPLIDERDAWRTSAYSDISAPVLHGEAEPVDEGTFHFKFVVHDVDPGDYRRTDPVCRGLIFST